MHQLSVSIALILCLAAQRVHSQHVFAHFMAQNSYPYSPSDWQSDISTAAGIGIDGFALNIAQNDYEVAKIADAYTVAEAMDPPFQLFYSFDASYSWSASDIVTIISNHASSPSSFKYGDALLVSTYSGEQYGNDFWTGIKQTLADDGITVTFAPAFTSYRDPSLASQLLSDFPVIDGFFNWWSWPQDVPDNLTTATDVAYQAAIQQRSGPYIMSVSPWQFKNLGTSDTDWVEQSDYLWLYRWQQAIDLKPDIVEIDYIGEINPNVDLGDDAPNYVDGFPHSAWRNVAQYFISWYKTGSAPAVSDDQIVFWYRAHPKVAACPGLLPRNADYPADAVFALALLKTPSTITLDIGSNHYQWDAQPGASMGAVPFPTEDAQIPYFQIIQGGTKVKDGYGSVYVTQTDCNYYNFNPFVGLIA
ncbi:glycoside hydrolase family 71 protein [Punctularia strigosozonata HHB-11173 SS5]|uniref:glycoside hydrolase family 71 protein n=1 Tax=Punctularia strigosozonata (strain HHB-11173) TaxID=741275 RepID=UPI00044165EA|nr:glycoside hydrolase family 71 protein [Punctularia strigosozonata HHB-11173 SS5]EIN07586.1 glycoside hydrolase family 71 protein [Punctularia strigosozonata HHB-11173 SS5]